MTRAVKVTFVLSAILGIAVGGRLGYSQGADLGEASRSVEPIIASGVLSAFAERQSRYADPDHARQAAKLQISMLEQLRTAADDTSTRGQLGLAYVRLAVVEKAAGNQDAEHLALKQARVWLPVRSGQDASDERLEDLLKKLDQAGIGLRTPKTTDRTDGPAHSSLER